MPHAASEAWVWAWLAGGGLVLLLVPAARTYSPLFGWVAYWLVGAPLVILAARRGRGLAKRLAASLVRRGSLRHAGEWRQGNGHRRRQGRRLAARPAAHGVFRPLRRGLSALFSP